MKTIATATLTYNSRYTIAVYSNCKGLVSSVDVLEQSGASPISYEMLDLLKKILPKNLYTAGMNVELGKTINQGHPCLIVRNANDEKRYRLDKPVSNGWIAAIPSAHLRAMVKWWRLHREEYEKTPVEWCYWQIVE